MPRTRGSKKLTLSDSLPPGAPTLTTFASLIALIPLALLTLPVKAENPTSGWTELHKRATDLLWQGRAGEAQTVLEESIRAACLRREASPGLAAALNDLGTLLHDSGRLLEAERAYKESVTLWNRIAGPNPKLGIVLGNLAGLRRVQGRPSDAEKLYRQAEPVLVSGYGAESPEVALSLCGLADVYLETGRYEKARQSAERALVLLEGSGRDPEVGAALFLAAKIAWKGGRESEAERLLRRAVDLWARSLGTQNPTYASGLTSLAVILSRKDPGEANRLFRQSLDLLEAQLGPNHAFTGFTLVLYAKHLEARGVKSEAKSLKRRGEAILAGHSRQQLSGHTIDLRALRQANGR